MKVRIRREADFYLAYFIDLRMTMAVNEVGSVILDMVFNQNMDGEEIVREVSELYKVPAENVAEDMRGFLSVVESEIHPYSSNDEIDRGKLRSPLGAEIEITTACNLRCRHCFQPHYDEIFMPTDKVAAIIERLARDGVCEINLVGGEPLVHKGVPEIIALCNEKDLVVNLVTNGTLIDDALVKELARAKYLEVSVSLDGMEKIHDKIRGAGSFTKVDAALRRLCDHGISTGATFTINAINVTECEAAVAYCNELGIPCNFNLFKPFKEGQKDLTLDPAVFFDTIVKMMRLRQEKSLLIGLSNSALIAEIMGLDPRNECRATISGLVIDVHGRMITCPLLASAGYYPEEDLPLFDNLDFLEVWHNHRIFREFRENGLEGCQARSLIFSGDVHGHDPYAIQAFLDHQNRK